MATVRSIQGVNPSYFASMPTIALDPNAGKPDPQYARLLSDAMQNNAAQTDRRREKDQDNAFKATDQRQQAYRDIRANEINKRNAAVNEAGEARLKSGAEFGQDRLKQVDTERLIEALHQARDHKDTVAEGYFLDELEKRGVNARLKQNPNNASAPAAPPAAPPPPTPGPKPVDRTPLGPPPGGPPPTARFPDAAEASAAPPMKGAPAGVAPRATASFPPVGAGAAPPPGASPAPPPSPPPAARPAGPPARPMASDSAQFYDDMNWKPPAGAAPSAPPPGRPMASDNAQLYRDMEWKPPAGPAPAPARPMASDNAQFYNDMDWHPPTEKELLDRAIADVVAREKAGLSPTAKPLLPGKTLRRRASESDQLLSPDDPLGKAP